MEIEYKLEVEDLIVCQKHTLLHGPPEVRLKRLTKLRVILALLTLVPLSILGWNIYRAAAFVPMKDMLPILVPVALCLAAFVTAEFLYSPARFIERTMRRKARMGVYNKAMMPRRLAVSKDALVVLTEDGGGTLGWRGVDRIEQIAGYALIYSSPHDAAIVPKAVFQNDLDFQAFVDKAKEYLSAAKNDSEPT